MYDVEFHDYAIHITVISQFNFTYGTNLIFITILLQIIIATLKLGFLIC